EILIWENILQWIICKRKINYINLLIVLVVPPIVEGILQGGIVDGYKIFVIKIEGIPKRNV
uniref:hypothetical protein n=1 Tax=Bacillus thuringiensis TaxID=1428 RepID=UPI001C92DF5D